MCVHRGQPRVSSPRQYLPCLMRQDHLLARCLPIQLGRLSEESQGCPSSSRDRPVSTSPILGLQVCVTTLSFSFLMWVLGVKLRSSRLYGKYFFWGSEPFTPTCDSGVHFTYDGEHG